MNIKMKIKIAKFFVTGFYIGLAPIAPGSFGSLLGVILFLLLQRLFGGGVLLEFLAIILLSALSMVLIPLYLQCESVKGCDPKEVVIDEVVGQMISLTLIFYFVPTVSYSAITVLTFFTSYITFRFFDILKPWPISFIDQKMEGAKGIMLDDIVAGLFSAVVTLLFLITVLKITI